MNAKRNRRRTLGMIAGLAGLLLAVAGIAEWSDSRVEAGVRRSEPADHFQSGGQRSQVLLSQILTTLQRMDERMARIEVSLKRAAAALPEGSPREVERQP